MQLLKQLILLLFLVPKPTGDDLGFPAEALKFVILTFVFINEILQILLQAVILTAAILVLGEDIILLISHHL